ncbi:hypothetical protein FRB94_002849 [Tulasnella sp. JGI-2019a]|nr:hypothetical protein FRB94_002849 [Tulasnella sp. JGI-2019a]
MSPSPHLRFGSQPPQDDAPNIVSLQEHSTQLDVDAASVSDDDTPPETISLQSGKAADQIRVLKERELARKRKDANKNRDAGMLAKKLEFERKVLRQQKKSERNLAKNLKRRSKLRSSMSAKESDSLPGPETVGMARSGQDEEHLDVRKGMAACMKRAMVQTEDENAQESGQESAQEGWGGVLRTRADASENPEVGHHLRQSNKPPHHLPDSIFAAAANSAPIKASVHESLNFGISMKQKPQTQRDSKVRSLGVTAKDVIIGSRTVRPVAAAAQIGSKLSLQAPKSTTAFITRRLDTKGKAAHEQWQRKSAHLALQPRTGPARAFANAKRQ